MHHKLMLCTLILVLGLASAADAADLATYRMDSAHSMVGFSVRHFTVSQVRGEFEKFTGKFQVDESDLTRSQFEVRIQSASLNTKQEQRDADLRSDRFLNVESFPEIAFRSKRIERTGDAYVAYGDLTIRGVTREVPLAFTLVGPIKDPLRFSRIGVEATATINRQDYDITWNKVMEGGGFVVGNEVKISINVELVKVDPETGKPIPVE